MPPSPPLTTARPAGPALALLVLAATACTPQAPAPSNPRFTPIETIAAQPTGDSNASYDGVVRRRRLLDLAFRQGGRVRAVPVRVGERVRAGQVLAILDQPEARAALAQAAGERAAADATRHQADDEAARATGLDQAGALASAEVRQRAYAADSAHGKAQAAAAAQRRAAAALGEGRLLAPAGGVVTAIVAEPGTVVGAGAAVVRLATGAQEVEIALPETVAPAPGSSATLQFPARPGLVASAQLRVLYPEVDPGSRLRRAVFTLAAGTPELPINSSATATLAAPAVARTVRVPITALGMNRSRAYVMVLTRDGAHVQPQSVQALALRGADAIVAGLAPGRLLVVSGIDTLRPGQAVANLQTDRQR